MHLLAELPAPPKNVLDSTIQITNYSKSGSFNTCLFKELCKDMKSTHEVLFHMSVRWLSKGNVLNCISIRSWKTGVVK